MPRLGVQLNAQIPDPSNSTLAFNTVPTYSIARRVLYGTLGGALDGGKDKHYRFPV